MIIQVGEDGSVRLVEADDFRRFSIRLADSEPASTALAGIARLDGPGHAWIDPGRVRSLAGDAGPGWADGFAAMAAYAAGKGWTDENGALRAHIERA